MSRVAIVLDVDDDPDHLYFWAGVRTARLVVELRQRGIEVDPIRIDIDDVSHVIEGR